MNSDSHFSRGDTLHAQNRYEQAMKEFLAGALAGDALCMSRLALMYTNGEGLSRSDLALAEIWERKAAEAGASEGLFNLGITLRMQGKIIQARKCFEAALLAGDNDAALELARLLSASPKEKKRTTEYLALYLADALLSDSEKEEAIHLLSLVEEDTEEAGP